MIKIKHTIFLSLFFGICKPITPTGALVKLKSGNNIFASNPEAFSRSEELSLGQSPMAVIVGCSDSRATPAMVFNSSSLGQLFEIRNAGNIVDCSAIGSIEYAVEHLKAPLIVVLGHQNCGAVEAALQSTGQNEDHSECIQSIINNINTNSRFNELRQKSKDDEEFLTQAIKSNVCQSVEKISQQSQIIKKAIKDGRVQIIGAYYNFNGNVEWLNCNRE
jgi:carbonic anhydrase